MIKSLKTYLPLLFIIILFSCQEEKQTFKLLKVTEHSSLKVSDSALVKLLEQENNINIEIEYTLYEDFAVKQLDEDHVDLVILPNNAFSNDVDFRLLTPLLPRLLIIYTNKPTEITDLRELFEKGIIFFEDRSRLDSLFFKTLYYNFNIDESKIKTKKLDELDLNSNNDNLLVYVGLTHLNNSIVKQLADTNWSLFSLDNIENYGKGSKVEGFSMMNISAYPFLIPMYIYKGKPEKSVLTVAIKDVLIANKDFDDNTAYAIVKTLVEHKVQLIKMNNIYNLLNFDFDKQVWAFPLHQGAQNYIERDKPFPWMRWVNITWPILSIIVIFIGALSSFRSGVKKRRTQKIESYYTSLNEIKEKALLSEDASEITSLLHELNELKADAINSLANNKFYSSESFNIFLALYSDIKNDLYDKLS